MVLPDSPRVSRVPGYLGNIPQSLCRPLPDCHRLWCRFPPGFAWQKDFLLRGNAAALPGCSRNPDLATPAGLARDRFGLFRVRSPLLAESRLISLPRGTKMFQFPRFPPLSGAPPITVGALPHSGILGSSHARCFPRHFAVRRALHRLLAPRHPPAALCSLIIQIAEDKVKHEERRDRSLFIPHPSSFILPMWIASPTASLVETSFAAAAPPPGGAARLSSPRRREQAVICSPEVDLLAFLRGRSLHYYVSFHSAVFNVPLFQDGRGERGDARSPASRCLLPQSSSGSRGRLLLKEVRLPRFPED